MEKYKESKLVETQKEFDKKIELTGEKEIITDPDKNLALIIKNKRGDSGSTQEDPRKKYIEEDDDKSKMPESKKDDEKKQEEQVEIINQEDIINPYKKFLEDLIEQDEREKNLEELEKAKKSPEYQEKKAEIERNKELLQKLKEAREKEREPEPEEEGFSDKEIVAKYQELEKELAPFADKMAQAWLEVVNNIAKKIEVFKEKYFRQGKLDIKKVQKLLPLIEMGEDIDGKLVYELFVEKIKTELRPKMLRVELLVDNSGSMSSNINEIRMVVMLLNSSLRSFRILFRDTMRDILGMEAGRDIDLVCDTEIRTFGAKNRLIKPFKFKDLSFLESEKKEEVVYPEINVDQETIDTLRTFQKITASEGDTLDAASWKDIYNSHNDEKIKRLLAENKLTEIVFQISDGEIGQTETSVKIINELKKINIANAGLGIGADAVSYLRERHGDKNVIPANTPQEIVEKFGELLKQVIVEQVQKPMERYLEELDRL